MDEKTVSKFIESWGTMGSVWGINASMARIHALLIVSERPLSLDHIAKTLRISRGNASMCLKELRNWGVVRLVKEPGDRQDYYVTEPDVWKMFFAIARERKRREFDPVLTVVRETLSPLHKGASDIVRLRLKQMEDLLTTLNFIAERSLTNDKRARSVLSFLSRFVRKKNLKE